MLDDLNAFLKPHGVYFAANLSPSNRATLGGMVATDASGEGSRRHGKTSQHVVDLEVVLRGGIVHRTARVAGADLDALCAEPGLLGQAHKLVREIATARREEIASTFPKLRRYMTGYNLVHMAASDGSAVDLAQLVVGSEGSLGVVTEARLRLTHFEPHRALLVLRYPSFDAALASANGWSRPIRARWRLSTRRSSGSRRATSSTTRCATFSWTAAPRRRAPSTSSSTAATRKPASGSRSTSSCRRSPGARAAPAPRMATRSRGSRTSARACGTFERRAWGSWATRQGSRKPVPFVEDTVVPPENLQAYVREFRALLDAEGLRYGMFGHVDVGCLHVRPALDLKDPEDEARVRRITDAVAALVTRYGGLLWGEHGKGFRSELVPHHFGPVLYPELQRIKAVFDPRNQLNPGKVATPAGARHRLARVDGPTRGALDRQIAPADREALGTVIHCNGNGQCFDTSTDNLMCPSSKITRDRIHSPKGRATLMREWLRLLATAGVVATQALQARGGLPWLCAIVAARRAPRPRSRLLPSGLRRDGGLSGLQGLRDSVPRARGRPRFPRPVPGALPPSLRAPASATTSRRCSSECFHSWARCRASRTR